MPMPTPRNDESHTEFMDRCMGDSVMNDDFEDGGQRYAVCMRQWNDAQDKGFIEFLRKIKALFS